MIAGILFGFLPLLIWLYLLLFHNGFWLLRERDTQPVAEPETWPSVVAVVPARDEADVIAQANATQYGLAAYFYARDLGRVFRVAEALEYGMVGVNSGIISTEVAPFGGVKQSGLGREGSRHGIEEFVEIKYVLLGGLGA